MFPFVYAERERATTQGPSASVHSPYIRVLPSSLSLSRSDRATLTETPRATPRANDDDYDSNATIGHTRAHPQIHESQRKKERGRERQKGDWNSPRFVLLLLPHHDAINTLTVKARTHTGRLLSLWEERALLHISISVITLLQEYIQSSLASVSPTARRGVPGHEMNFSATHGQKTACRRLVLR